MGKRPKNATNLQLLLRRFRKDSDSTTKIEKIILGAIALLITFIIISIISGVSALMNIESKSMPSSISADSDKPVNILVLGMDIGDANQADNNTLKRADTIMVLNYNPINKNLHIVSVPRDMLIKINNKNVKINSAYEIGGYPKIKSEVEDMLNVNINYIAKIDYAAFREIVDSIGGVEMKIDRNMIYDDDAQNLHINFKSGETVTLDGEKAEEFFRWRKNNDGSGFANGDLDRIDNQHKFISKVIDKCTSPLILFRIPKIMSALGDNIETNMSPIEVMSYGLKFMNVKRENVTMSTVSGIPKTINGESFLVFDKSLNKEILAMVTSSSVSKSTSQNISKDDIRIKILNATKISGLAAKAKKQLNDSGYTKIDTGNTDISDKSVMLSNDSDKLKAVKQDLNIQNSDKKENKTEYNEYDVIIILGKDYEAFGK